MSKKFDLAIIGCAGIPAAYGGFETLAEQLILKLASSTSMLVFCSRADKGGGAEREMSDYKGAQLVYVGFKANGWESILYDCTSMFRAAPVARTILVLGVSGCLFLPIIRLLWPNY